MGLSVSLRVSVCVSVEIVRIGHTRAKITNVKNDVCRFLYLPSNSVITKIALGDLDLLFWRSKL